MKETDDVCLYVFASIALNQVNTVMAMVAKIKETDMPSVLIENTVTIQRGFEVRDPLR